ncbi:MAG: class I SAM-dependent methyltransferase [Spirochaetes bacterium]|nr:class I SAM-dependent methyltransferase [Spirochaetota bacterium]
MRLKHIDENNEIDWGNTSDDYGKYRPGYPQFVYDFLFNIGIGKNKQKIIDLGTGTGVLARAFAKNGAVVTGVDVSVDQIRKAVELSKKEKLDIKYIASKIEDCEFNEGSFDMASSGQSWIYFDPVQTITKLMKWLIPKGKLLLMHLSWLPYEDEIAAMTEKLILQFNPSWKGANYKENRSGKTYNNLRDFSMFTFQKFIVPVEFTQETWRGRMRSCRGIGASLDHQRVAEFDLILEEMLKQKGLNSFTVLHEILIHVFQV